MISAPPSSPIDAQETSPPDASRLDVPSQLFLGVRFHALTINETLDQIEEMIRRRIPRQLNFVNAYTLTVCRRNQAFADILNGSALNLADGMSVVWGARWLDMKFPGRVAGPDLSEALCARAEKKGYRVFFMGSSWDNLTELKKSLLQRYPALKIVGVYSPPVCDEFGEAETTKIIAEVKASSPDVLFVGVSTGKQEKWLSQNLNQLNVPVCLAVGAAFDFLSGRIPRAPEWLRVRGLEWLYRLYREPRRLWKRYLLGNAVFLLILFKKSVKMKFAGNETSERS